MILKATACKTRDLNVRDKAIEFIRDIGRL